MSGWRRQNGSKDTWAEFSWDRNMKEPVGKITVASKNLV